MTFAVLQYIIIAGGENVPEKTITMRVDEKLHTEIKIKATQKGNTIKDYILELVKKDLHDEAEKK